MNLPQDLINILLGLAFSVGGWFARVVTVNYLMESLHFEYPQVLAMASQLLGMTAQQVDQMFVAAAKL